MFWRSKKILKIFFYNHLVGSNIHESCQRNYGQERDLLQKPYMLVDRKSTLFVVQFKLMKLRRNCQFCDYCGVYKKWKMDMFCHRKLHSSLGMNWAKELTTIHISLFIDVGFGAKSLGIKNSFWYFTLRIILSNHDLTSFSEKDFFGSPLDIYVNFTRYFIVDG